MSKIKSSLSQQNTTHQPSAYWKKSFPHSRKVHPQSLTWNLKMMVSNRNLLFQWLIFRFHVKIQGCRLSINSSQRPLFSSPLLPRSTKKTAKMGPCGRVAWFAWLLLQQQASRHQAKCVKVDAVDHGTWDIWIFPSKLRLLKLSLHHFFRSACVLGRGEWGSRFATWHEYMSTYVLFPVSLEDWREIMSQDNDHTQRFQTKHSRGLICTCVFQAFCTECEDKS